MSNGIKAFLAAACGALMGALIALELSGMAALSLGVIIGGIIGYIGYAPMEAWRALRQACRQVFIDERKAVFTGIAVIAILLVYLACTLAPFYVAVCLFNHSQFFAETSLGARFFLALMLFFVYAVVALVGFILSGIPEKHLRLFKWTVEGLRDLAHEPLWCVLMWNPLSFGAIIIPVLIPLLGILLFGELVAVGLVKLIVGLLWIVRIFWMTVLPQTISAIHSEARLVVGIAAALGAATGFFAGSALTGALVGGVLGLTDVAFLRKRLLMWCAKERKIA